MENSKINKKSVHGFLSKFFATGLPHPGGLIGGTQLALLGGSWYYLLTGIALIVSAVLIWRGNAWGGALRSMLLWTIVWSLSEVGLDFWTLLPRLSLIFVLGILLLTPSYRHTVTNGPIHATAGKSSASVLVLAMIGIMVIGLSKGDKYALPKDYQQ